MSLRFTRDYRNRNTGLYGFSTGVYQNIGERVSFRYIDFQIRGIGQLSFNWTVKCHLTERPGPIEEYRDNPRYKETCLGLAIGCAIAGICILVAWCAS